MLLLNVYYRNTNNVYDYFNNNNSNDDYNVYNKDKNNVDNSKNIIIVTIF